MSYLVAIGMFWPPLRIELNLELKLKSEIKYVLYYCWFGI
jgi:hypothetical protein